MVTTARLSLRQRAKVLPAFLGFVSLGLASLWLCLPGLVSSVGSMVRHAPLIVLQPREAIGVPLAFVFFALAGITLSPAPTTGGQRPRKPQKHGRRGIDGPTVCLSVAMGSALATVISIPITEFVALELMSHLGYLPCPASLHWEHHPPMRWSLSDGRCP